MIALTLIACPAPTTPNVDAASPVAALPTAAEYAAACEAELGPIPPLSCADVDPVPQQATQNDGTVVDLVLRTDATPDGTCDRPSMLSGCVPGSRAGAVDNARGTRFTLLCRVRHADTPDGQYDDLALLARDERTGRACMWASPEDGQPRDGDDLPVPGSAGSEGIWADIADLAAIGCRSCHDGNGLVVTPWIAGNLPPSDPAGPLDLLFADALASVDPTWAGTALWIHPDAAPCTSCHPLPQGPLCALGPAATGRLPDGNLSPALTGWPTDRWMDDLDAAELVARHGTELGWEQAFGAAADRLLACCGAHQDGCWR